MYTFEWFSGLRRPPDKRPMLWKSELQKDAALKICIETGRPEDGSPKSYRLLVPLPLLSPRLHQLRDSQGRLASKYSNGCWVVDLRSYPLREGCLSIAQFSIRLQTLSE